MKKALFQPVPLFRSLPHLRTDLAGLVLRLVLAGIFLYHGLDKVFGPGNEGGANWLARQVQADAGTDFHSPLLLAVQLGVAWGEVLAGAALGLGLLTRVAAGGMFFIQTAAILLSLTNPVFSPLKGGGDEYNFALLAMCLALLFLGGGMFSVDRLLRRSPKPAAQAKPGAAPAGSELVSAPGG